MRKYKIIGGFKLKTSLSPKKLDSLNSTQQSFYEQALVNLHKKNEENQSINSNQKYSPSQTSLKRDNNNPISQKVRKIQVSRPGTSFLNKKRCISPVEQQFDDTHIHPDNEMADLIQKFTIRSQHLMMKLRSRDTSPNREQSSTQRLENIAEKLLNPKKKKSKDRSPRQQEPQKELIQQQSHSQSKFIFNRRKDTVQKNGLDRYQVLNTIGTGSYARVRLAKDKLTNEQVAIKTYSKARMTNAAKKLNLVREINILKRLNHSGIVKLLDTVETIDEFHLVQEYGGCTNLRQYLQQKRKLLEEEVKEIMRQIVEAINYCHQNNIIHRDIKLENILIDNKIVKIIDFGFSVYMPKNQKITSYCGTPTYMAPEILKKEEYYARPIDIWAMGVLLYVLMSNKFPFKGGTDEELNNAIIRGKYQQVNGSYNCQLLINKMLEQVSSKRISAQEMLNENWFQ